MHILSIILLGFAGIIALVLVAALLLKKRYFIEREIIVDAPLQPVFDYLKYLRNWDNFNKASMADRDSEKVFTGTDGSAGFIYAWSGNKKVGQGEKEIKSISDGKEIATEIRFVKPFVAVGHTNMTTSELPGNQTRVTMSNTSKLKYPLNILIPMVEKGITKDMDSSLLMLKDILEKQVP